MVPRYNAVVAGRGSGRPLAASTAQVDKVRELRAAGRSLRAAAETGLSLRTIRTILDKDAGKDRATARAHELRRVEFPRLRVAAFRARVRKLDALPKEIARLEKERARLGKAAKGLGGRR